MPPEMKRGSFYTQAVDFFSLAAMIVNVAGQGDAYPRHLWMTSNQVDVVFARRPFIPAHFPFNLSSLITRMLEVNPKRRLGGSCGGQEIMKDACFVFRHRGVEEFVLEEVRQRIRASRFPRWSCIA